MLELRAITKKFDTVEISDISFEVNDGEYFVIVGPSGVGKTVLLEIIAGLTGPTSGRILFNGTDITALPPQKRAFAVVYQDYALFPHLTVAGNIAYGLRAKRVERKTIKNTVLDTAKRLGIEDLLDRSIDTLSAGQAQRVALARALASRPRMLLLDEPLSALDTGTRVTLRKELRQIARQFNTTVIHITHDPEEAMALSDRICVMLNHRIRQIAAPVKLFRGPSDPAVAKFLGIRNILPISGVESDICMVYGHKIHASAAKREISHIWIKPEEILLSTEPFDSSARNQLCCTVTGWEHSDSLLAVSIAAGALKLAVLITHASFEELKITRGAELYATFKSSAIHCF